MVRKVVTPPINATGVFVCKAPFALELDAVYKCDAIRTFKELALRGIDVYVEYYSPKGIVKSEYEQDVNLNASIITLKSATGEFLYVPDTYVESYPGLNGLDYVRTVIALDLNLHMSATIDLSFLEKELASIVKKNVGVECTPHIASVSYDGNVTHEQHVQMEAARQVAISQHVPLSIQLEEAREQIDSLEEQSEELMRIIAAHPELGVPVKA